MSKRLDLATAIAVALASAAAQAQTTDNKQSERQPQQLPKVSVETTEGSYKADAVSSPKFTQPLVDTPQTITVIKKEIIQEQGALSLSDALRNTPGITFQAGENGNTQSGDAIFMRGFDAQGSIFLDNVRDLGPAVRDVFNIEQIEIAKGPAGADNGRGAAAGYVNLVSKTPLAEDALGGTLSYGENSRRRITADLNETLGETTAVRLNLIGQDGGVAGRDFIERQTWGVAPSITLGMGTDTRISLFTQHTRQDNTPDGGISAIGISGYRNAILADNNVDALPVDSDNFYGLTSDFEDIVANLYTVRIEHDLASGVTVRNLSRYGRIEQERVLTAPLQAPVVSDDPDGTGPLPPVMRPDPNTWTVGRSRHASFRENKILTNQTNVTADFKTGALEHNLSGGLEFIYEEQFTPAYTAATGQVAANLYNPNRNDPGVAVSPSGASTDGNTTTQALYVFDTIKLTDRWQVNGGLRGERYQTETTGIAAPVAPATTGLASRYTDSDALLSWKAGVLFKPLPNGSVYVAYANSLRPPSGDNFTLVSPTTGTGTPNANINSPALEPQESKNLELGTKWDLLDGKLAATAAVFKSDNRNDLARTDPLDPDSVVQYGKREVKGVELGLVGQVTDAWQMSFGYTHQNTDVSEGTFGGTQTGASINFSPKNSATLWTSYKLPFPLTVAGGLRYLDSQTRTINVDLASVTTGIVEVDSYTVFDAMATYDLTKNFALQLNGYNLTDEDYVASVNNSGQRYFHGTPRSFLLTLNWKL